MLTLGVPELLVLAIMAVIALVTTVIPYWKIFGRAGFSKGLAFLMFIPIINIIVLWVFAFSRWPIEAREGKPQRASNS